MRRPSKESSPKLPAESQRLISIAQAVVSASSRIEERAWEHSLDTQLHKLLKANHQDTIDSTLNALFREDLNAYDVLMEGVEAVSESTTITVEDQGSETRYHALLVAAPILAWTRFSIAQGAIPADMLATLHAHFAAHLLAGGTRLAIAPVLYAIDQLPRTHAETFGITQKLAAAALKGSAYKPAAKAADTAPFLADTRYLLAAVVAPVNAPLFRWQEPEHVNAIGVTRAAALEQWRAQATPNLARLLPGCGIELLLPEAYYVACREADKQIRPVSVRAAVHYLTNTLGIEAGELRAVIAGFGEENNDNLVDEYRIGFTLRQENEVVYGIVWPLYGQEDEEGTPADGSPPQPNEEDRRSPVTQIVSHLNECGVHHIKRHSEHFIAEYCDDCGAPLFADPAGELVHAEMPEDTPTGTEHFH
ncbi:DUF2863 family protein [Massilia sp. TS11]|uniref:DUF2863 family protein n=1 Tax=Massilia sp. TS11 TaxID=2908003 RepID=UPI001EDC813A|nr:DUF2863 family protein [Massilia sp. TS11]MCG2583091.1 DUF2863 family protein [Massilia sp. TS11]